MAASTQALSEKEKQTLRLIVRGHDAKSMARHLGLSVHTVNERLRDARRKLEVSSSREAARLLLNTEGNAPQNLADEQMGEDAAARAAAHLVATEAGEARASRAASRARLIAGGVVMSVIIGILALAAASQSDGGATSSTAPTAVTAAEAEVVGAARNWLVLHDEGRWRETWNGTSEEFRKLNTVEVWTDVAQKVRPPLGAVISRTVIGHESVPAPPAGVQVVKFRTKFANKSDAVETVSLARQEGKWKVAGIYID